MLRIRGGALGIRGDTSQRRFGTVRPRVQIVSRPPDQNPISKRKTPEFGLCIPLDSLRRTATAEACFAVATAWTASLDRVRVTARSRNKESLAGT